MKREVLIKFGKRVRDERMRLGLSQEELARASNTNNK
jgi:transcriptional regulator with XRE-family HTH domain